jgi:Transglycosylase SLT domain
MAGHLRVLAAVPLAALAWGCSSGTESAGDRAAPSTKAVPTTATVDTSSTTTSSTTTTVPGPPVAADTPAGLAVQVTEAERAIRNPGTPAPELARAGHTQQVVYGRLGAREELQAEVLALVPPDVRPVAEANTRAVTELARQARADVAAYGGGRSEPPDWRIVAPPPPGELMAHYREAEAATGVPWQYLAAIHFVETRMGRIRGNSVAGAQGPMQFIPSTWEIYGDGGDIDDTADAIQAAARLLRANGAPSDMASALYSYNPSNRYVRAITTYAEQMMADERAYLGYYHWQVYFGGRLLPEGYGS